MAAEDSRSVEAVGELCRLALVASRLGCRVQLLDVDAGLHDLIVLAGVGDLLLDDEAEVRDLP
ncbi:MAG: hypothetical protein ABI239_11155 [Aquihabitans sp.]